MKEKSRIRELENKLFKGWRKDLPRFVPDGLVDQDTFENAKIKAVFLLKDTNDPPSDTWSKWDLRDVLYNKKFDQHQTMWTVIARWIYELNIEKIKWNDKDRNKPFLNNYHSLGNFHAMMHRQIAVVNCKKVGGGGQTDKTRLRSHIINYHHEIRSQLTMYGADLIITGGIPKGMLDIIFADIEKTENKSSNGLMHWHFPKLKTHLISYYHPACRIKHEVLHYTLVDAAKEVLKF